MTERRRKSPTAPTVRPPESAQPPGKAPKPTAHPIGTPRGLSTNTGILAVAGWLAARGIYPPMGRRWLIEAVIGIADAPASFGFSGTRFQIMLSSDEWGFAFSHDGRASSIRVADVPYVHDRDDFQLLAQTPALKNLGALIRQLEQRHGIFFQRRYANVRTNLAGAEVIVKSWIMTL